MLALSSLALATMLFSAPSARAGHWEFTCTGNGSRTTNYGFPGMLPETHPWMPPGTQSGSFSLGSAFGNGSDYANSYIATLTVTVTAAWKPDGGEDDTVPKDVWLCESASADWSYGQSGSADDGFGDAAVPNGGSGGATSFTASSNPTPPYVPAPPPHWKKYPVSGGSVTLPARTLKAEADFPSSSQFPYGGLCAARIDSYNVTVHPTPYNWHVTNGQGQANSDGTLYYTFGYSSTSGKKADLADCYEHENVTYQGSNPYHPPYPFSESLVNPTIRPGTGANGYRLSETDYLIVDTQKVVASFPPPYAQGFTEADFTATQEYQYDDLATQEANVLIPGPDSSNSVVRSIKTRPGFPAGQWWYSCTKTSSGGNSNTSWYALN